VGDSKRVQAVRDGLMDLKSELLRAEDDALIESSLAPERVETFRSAVIDAWKHPQHLRSIVSSSIWQPIADEVSDAERADQRPGGFGSNIRVPKEYFVDLQTVHADSADLGREFGEGVGRGEDVLILSELQSTLPTLKIPFDGFAKEVERSVDHLTQRGLHPTVLIINSWELLTALRDLVVTPDQVWATADPDKAPRFKRTDAPLLLRYEDSENVCIVADFRAAIAIRQGLAQPESPDDFIHEDGWLLIGVAPIGASEAREILAATRVAEESTVAESPDETSERRIRKQVHVRVLEWILIDVVDPTAGTIIRVQGVG